MGAEGTCSPKAVFQAVKAICALAGGVETLHLTYTLNAFAQACTAQVLLGYFVLIMTEKIYSNETNIITMKFISFLEINYYLINL